MAKIPLKEIVFPGLDNTYTIPEIDNTLSTAGKAADAKETGDKISELKEDLDELNSNFTDMVADMESDGAVPSAEQILTDKGVTDSVPYRFRKTGGDGADRLYDQIVGGTVCWNQLVENGNFESLTGWIVSGGTVSGNVVTFPVQSVDGWSTTLYRNKGTTGGHKLVAIATVKTTVDDMFRFRYPNLSDNKSITANIWTTFSAIITISNNGDRIGLQFAGKEGGEYSVKNFTLFDLTAMFGSTIADYIYSLEQSTAGAGVAFFKKLFPNDYYEYNAGKLKSVEGVSAHEMVGFNQWDEEWEIGVINTNTGQNTPYSESFRSKNYIPCLPNTRYYVKFPTGWTITGLYYDADKNYMYPIGSWSNKAITTPATCHYMRFIVTNQKTYNHDICINLSDPERNGEYEPYKAHSYPLDSTVELRGLFKLDANNKLYADGDTYEYTGKVTRNTILRAYQSGDESLANAITDGTNTVVYSANASTEQAEPYQHLQQCDPNGTEEYVSTGIVPIGHNSFYPENLRAKVEGLPWNFANLIAPTESTFTATRNYVTGDLFIVSNVLYKATSNIANGGTITPNTNCTATTLAEIISALA